ncbi:hypothetical protein HK101_000372, partial [Irineochytrium annulatum]
MTFDLIDIVTGTGTGNAAQGQPPNALPDSDWFKIGVHPQIWRMTINTETDPYPPFVFLSNLFASWGFAFAAWYTLLGRGRYNPGGWLQRSGIVDSALLQFKRGQNPNAKKGKMAYIEDPETVVVGLYLDGADKIIPKARNAARESVMMAGGA